jgi:hypothetical protein
MLRWWDHWLKGRDTGVMAEPMLRAWMTGSHLPAAHHDSLPGRWVAEPSWPPPGRAPHRLFLADAGLLAAPAPLAAREVCSPLSIGRHAGEWCPFGRGNDQADDQREDDARSLVFETPPLAGMVEILGGPVVTLEIMSDRPVAQLIARLCDVHPDGTSLRVSFGVLNLTHRDGSADPSALVPGQCYRVRLRLNDCGAGFPAGHRIRLALSTAYWPMVWPAPETATVTIRGGMLDLPVRPMRAGESLPPLPPPEAAPPDKARPVRPGVVRFDRIGLEAASGGSFSADIRNDDPLSATAGMHRSLALSRDGWRVRIETAMRMSCTQAAFRLEASVRAFDGDEEVCHRVWDRSIPRDLV